MTDSLESKGRLEMATFLRIFSDESIFFSVQLAEGGGARPPPFTP